jgi:hypothetical protein
VNLASLLFCRGVRQDPQGHRLVCCLAHFAMRACHIMKSGAPTISRTTKPTNGAGGIPTSSSDISLPTPPQKDHDPDCAKQRGLSVDSRNKPQNCESYAKPHAGKETQIAVEHGQRRKAAVDRIACAGHRDKPGDNWYEAKYGCPNLKRAFH